MLSRHLKYMANARIPEFESSHPARLLRVISGAPRSNTFAPRERLVGLIATIQMMDTTCSGSQPFRRAP
jgi:hypothetical protein